ncbi:glycoside hydrolase family 2 protein [Gandjariella thermophila]|uniref:Beta-mannosidase n=1 Tax=Gandjariella thermophila TaxID=1931992 RepID=A0A4D4JE13_9PSEU|nr:exo-beta-D-glucosaminidase [Gandjariella thermophila]GDY32143.1 beta-mannosidase [Gandjariella thermophila]
MIVPRRGSRGDHGGHRRRPPRGGTAALRRKRVPLLVAALGAALAMPGAPPATATPGDGVAAPADPGRVTTIPNWRMASSGTVGQDGAQVSAPGYRDTGWLTVPARSTVMGGLVAAGRYPDLGYSTNLRDKVDRKDFAVPWWYRRTFTADPKPGNHTFLRLTGGVIPSAEVWLNGSRVAGPDQVAGAYPAHEFDVTGLLRRGGNAVAIKAFPADPAKQLIISFVDWTQPAPDNNMGIWRDVQIAESGPVSVRNPRVVTALALPGLESAALTVKAEVRNNTPRPVTSAVAGTIGDITFARNVSLAPNETRTVTFAPADYPQLRIAHPRVWWPYQYGHQPLYHLDLTASTAGHLSDSAGTDFGIRDVKSTVNASGGRQFVVNGRPVLLRGGGWASDLFLRYDPKRLADQLGYVRDLGLNTIRLEGKEENDELYQLADRMGIMLLPGWECCSKWQSYDSFTEADHAVAAASAATEGQRLRNHPSVIGFYVGSDTAPPARVEQEYLAGLRAADWQVPIIPSAAKASSPQLGASGNKMDGPYWWVPPNYWYAGRLGGSFGFASEVGPGPTIPELDTLRKYLSPAELDDLWRNPTKPQYHLSPSPEFDKLGSFATALANRYGKPTSLDDFVGKAQLANYEVNRAEFESFGRDQSNKDNPATGVIYWMLNNAWPTLYWHLFDHALSPAGSYFGAKTALRPLHVQYSYDDRSVALVNTGLADVPGLSVRTTVFDLSGAVKSDRTTTAVTAKDSGSTRLDPVPKPTGVSGAYFVRLLLLDAAGNVLDRNVYWLSTKDDTLNWDKSTWYDTPQSGYADLTGLQHLPRGTVDARASSTRSGDMTITSVTLTNPAGNGPVAFFLRASVHKGHDGDLVLPVTWSDDDVTLWPGETVTLQARYRTADLAGAAPIVTVSGFNVPERQVQAR